MGCGVSEHSIEVANRLHAWISQNTKDIDFEPWPRSKPYSFRFPVDQTGKINPPMNFSAFFYKAGFEKIERKVFPVEFPSNESLYVAFWSKDHIDVAETWSNGAYHISIDDHGCGGGGALAKKLKVWINQNAKGTTYTYGKSPTIDIR